MAYPKTITPKNNAIIQGIEGIQIWDTHVLSFAFAGEAEKSIALDTLHRYGSSGQFHALDTADAVATDFRDDFMISIAGYSHIANLTFTAASEFDNADLKFTGIDNLDHGNTAGVTSFPGRDHKAGGGFESYLFINTDGSGMHLSHELGGSNFAISVIIHEMGHTLGLAHPHDTGNGSTKWASSSITASDDPLDNERYTVMSYEGGGLDVARARHGGHPVTPMALDVAAIQHMYGAVANFTGDTAYTMTDAKTAPLDLAGDDGTISIGRAFYCIWDTGGSDTIDYNGSDNALIDLKAATLSRTDNAATQAWIDELSSLAFFGALPKELRDDISNAAYHAGGFFSRIFDDSGNVQLGGYSIAKGAGIENGVGAAGNDVLIGNHLANHLTGNDGADVILGNHGADVLDGGMGADIFVFASENDSHNRKHDSITGFDAAHDKIDLWFAVTGVDPTVSANKFNHIDNAANAAHLAPGHAILVDVGADTYLLVDVNGAAGYQAGEDLIVQMNGVAAVTAGDFI